MSRFLSYINESDHPQYIDFHSNTDEAAQFIIKNCQPYLKKDFPTMFHRSIQNGLDDDAAIIATRTDRKPLNTPPEIHAFLDEWFLKRFGWRCRSTAVFASPSIAGTLSGDKCFIFPIGKYDYVYSPYVGDLLTTIEDVAYAYVNRGNRLKDVMGAIEAEGGPNMVKNMFATLDRELESKKFTNKKLNTVKDKRPDLELMIRCDSYIALKIRAPAFTNIKLRLIELLNNK